MVNEMARVTKPGGVVAGLNEGTRGILRSAENPEQEAEKALGINEHVHTIWAYLASFARAGLKVTSVVRSDGRPPYRPGGRLLRLPLVGPRLAIVAHLSYDPYGGVTIFARKRGKRGSANQSAAVRKGLASG
jgi:hypothetical protein